MERVVNQLRGQLPVPTPAIAGRTFLPDRYVGMNGLEKEHAVNLEMLRNAGKLSAWFYEAMTFKLADDTRYTPDFMVIEMDGSVVFHETKGFLRDDSYVKIKVCAQMFPFRFVMYQRKAKKDGGGWSARVFTKEVL